VPALIRFSNGSGNPAQRDGLPQVRGMAVKFTLPDGSTTDVLAARTRGGDVLTDELNTRLGTGPVRFYFRVQIGGPNDSTVDPSAPWHSTDIATVGTLDIAGLDTERERGDDIVVFDPMRATDGIEPSDDPVLRFRTHAYSASVKLRTGVDRGPEAPPA
jgi:catalase